MARGPQTSRGDIPPEESPCKRNLLCFRRDIVCHTVPFFGFGIVVWNSIVAVVFVYRVQSLWFRVLFAGTSDSTRQGTLEPPSAQPGETQRCAECQGMHVRIHGQIAAASMVSTALRSILNKVAADTESTRVPNQRCVYTLHMYVYLHGSSPLSSWP